MTCQHTMTLGVYLLGALEPTERTEFESHLSRCEICRSELVRLSPLPGLLNQISLADFADDLPPTSLESSAGSRVVTRDLPAPVLTPITEPVPLPSSPAVIIDTPDTPPRARRYWQVAAAAAVVLVLTIGGILGWSAIRGAAPPAAGVTWSATAPDSDVQADARLIDHEWGTEIQSKVANLPPGRKCYLVVYDKYGNHEVTGWWDTDHDPNEEIPTATSIPRSKIDRLEFMLDERTVVVAIPAPRR